MYVCVYVCVYVCMYVCMYVCCCCQYETKEDTVWAPVMGEARVVVVVVVAVVVAVVAVVVVVAVVAVLHTMIADQYETEEDTVWAPVMGEARGVKQSYAWRLRLPVCIVLGMAAAVFLVVGLSRQCFRRLLENLRQGCTHEEWQRIVELQQAWPGKAMCKSSRELR